MPPSACAENSWLRVVAMTVTSSDERRFFNTLFPILPEAPTSNTFFLPFLKEKTLFAASVATEQAIEEMCVCVRTFLPQARAA